MKPERNFIFTVEGQYYGAHGQTGLPIVKQYVAKFQLPSQEAALSVIVRHLLDPYLAKHYSDYARFRTHKITSMVTNGRLPDSKVLQMSFDDMGIEDLSDFCILKQILIDPYKHKSLDECRATVAQIYQSKLDQKKHDEKTGRASEQKEVDALLALNDLPKTDPTAINLNMQKAGAALKNAGDGGRARESVGSDTLSDLPPTRPAVKKEPVIEPATTTAGDVPLMDEEPVDNDPAKTAAAFAAQDQQGVEDIFA